jgi:NAD(P)-dependent dehydrogenase (short-subunit alcohol dehydrogenase family)
MNRLAGKTAIITGATGGIGEATAQLFVNEGANVMLVGRSMKKLQATRARLAADDRVAVAAADAADERATAEAVGAAVKAFGGVDILFANAGMEGLVRPIEAVEMQDFEQILRTNVLGVWLGIKCCIPPMKHRGGGSIIATSSVAGMVGFSGTAPYIASKHAVIGLVKAAAIEVAGFRIRVNAIAPGPIENRMIRSLETQISPENPDAIREGIKSQVPLKRYGTNEEVARLVLFLGSDESAYCSGGVYTIDGAYTTG